MTAGSGIVFIHESGHAQLKLFPEIMAGGVCLLDYDRDDAVDIYLVQAGSLTASATAAGGNRLYRNLGAGRFEDVTAAAGAGDTGYGMGCTTGDFDGDGYTDLYVTNVGANVLYRNQGDGTFVDVSAAAGVGDSGWGTSAAFLDFDADGALDLFVVNYVVWSLDSDKRCSSRQGRATYCSPSGYPPAPDRLLRNMKDGTFRDVTEQAGLGSAYGHGLGVAVADFDGDRRDDLYVANDGSPNQLWIVGDDGTFEDRALVAGCALNEYGTAEASMGLAAVDLDSDGMVDLFMSHLRGETNTVYFNSGGVFEDRTAGSGLGAPSSTFTGFGLACADFDHDTLMDCFIANGRVVLPPKRTGAPDGFAEPNQLFRGLDGARFEEVPRAGFKTVALRTSRGLAVGDLDNDGDLDLVIVNRDAPIQLLRNVAGNRQRGISFRLFDAGGRVALGAKVRIEIAGKWHHRAVQVAASYCSSHDSRVHFGLKQQQSVKRVVVRWPTGQEQQFGPFEAGRCYTLSQSDDLPVTPPPPSGPSGGR